MLRVTWRTAFIVWVTIPLVTACGGEAPSTEAEPNVVEPVVSWEDFKRSVDPTVRVVDGERIYLVEWDIPIRESKLYEYYVSHFVDTAKSTVDLLSDGVTDNLWTTPQELTITYCVSTSFGANHTRMRDEMARATMAWTRVAAVRFIYVSSADSNCVDSNPAVEIPVQPTTFLAGACAPFPNQDGEPHCSPAGRALIINIAAVENWATSPQADGTTYVNLTTESTLRHELGHVLGLRHEHIRVAHPGNIFVCDDGGETNYRTLTVYEKGSVMHYPWCDGVPTTHQTVTIGDGWGASRLYGPPAWRVASVL
jgi:hypothetical protein